MGGLAHTPGQPLRILILEDTPTDAELMLRELARAGFDPIWQRVDNERDYVAALEPDLDVVLSDFSLPGFDGLRALELLRARNLDVPFIIVSGSIGEETAVQILKGGAVDYLLKDRMARLGQAVRRAVDERRLQREKQDTQRALAEAEARMRFALDASHVGIWEADLTAHAARWSTIMEALHGLPAGSFCGTFDAFYDYVHPDDRQQVREAIELAMRRRTDANVVYRTAWPDGSVHWIALTGRFFYDHAATPARAAGVGIDVTEQRELEERYRQAQKMEAIGQLAGGVAHDFNNMLTAIDGYCELLAESLPEEPTSHGYLDELRRASASAASLTRQLLAFGRRQILEPKVLDLGEAVRAIEPMLKRLIGAGISMTVRVADGDRRVKADRGQIEQIIMNLTLNARDAMPDGGKLLLEVADVELGESYARQHASTAPGHHVMLAVSDTGIGMDAATQRRIFEPFFTTKQMGRGTGLGLATVYGIVKQSNGNVWVYSELGRGSVFKVYLPRVEAPISPAVSTSAAKSPRGSETILLVEDEELVRDVVRHVLERAGYRVLVAGAPREALSLAATVHGPIHLLMSDMVLPDMSGSALARTLLETRPGIRVLYMSGYTDDAVSHNGILEEGTPFLQKPFTFDALTRKVRGVLDAT